MEMCYGYPYDVISILVASILLNGVLSISLVRRIQDHEEDKATIRKLVAILKKSGWVQ